MEEGEKKDVRKDRSALPDILILHAIISLMATDALKFKFYVKLFRLQTAWIQEVASDLWPLMKPKLNQDVTFLLSEKR